MAISEELQRRIENLTGSITPGAGTTDAGRMSDQDMNMMMANQAARQGISVPEQRAAMIKKTAMDMGLNMTDATANAFGVGAMSFEEAMDRARGSNMDLMMAPQSAAGEFTEEDQELLDRLQQRESAITNAPLGSLVQELRQQGQEEDTELAHLRLGEVVLTPEMLEDDAFANVVERKFEEEGIDPEDATVGGIRNLNPSTGIQQFFLKKLAKGLKKVVKKVAPIAQFIPGPIGAAASIYNKGKTIVDVAKGKANPLALLSVAGPMRTGQSLSDSFKTLTGPKGGISGLFDQVRSGATSFFTDPMSTVSGLFKSQNPADYVEDASGNYVNKITGETLTREQFGNLASRFGSGIQALTRGVQGGLFGTEGIAGGITQGTGMGSTTYKDAAGNVYTKEQMVAAGLVNPTTGQVIQSVANQFTPSGSQQNTQQRGGVISNILGGGGGGGGLGDFAKVAGIGALAAGLGKLAYEDAKKQKGVALTPMVTMSPTGRYNIEAEIARRMGQARPNPVEFGLLPEGTLPVLSGGQPRQAALGGAIEELEGGMARGMMRGGIMAFAQGGAVAMKGIKPETMDKVRGSSAEPGIYVGDDVDEIILSRQPIQYDYEKMKKYMDEARLLDVSPRSVLYQAYKNNDISEDEYFEFISRADDLQRLEDERKDQREMKSLYNMFSEKRYENPMLLGKGGEILPMPYAQGGVVAMQEGGEMDPSQFPRMDGDINGPGTEQSDDIPAMLSDGEFVMTARAVRGAGSYEMKTEPGGIINLVPSLEEDRERGMDVMYKVMDTFSGQAQPS